MEQNRDAQLRSLLVLETSVAKDKLRSVLIYGGFPLSAKHVARTQMRRRTECEEEIRCRQSLNRALRIPV